MRLRDDPKGHAFCDRVEVDLRSAYHLHKISIHLPQCYRPAGLDDEIVKNPFILQGGVWAQCTAGEG